MKKKYLMIIQFIVLLIIVIGFVLYVFSKKTDIFDKEGFQNSEEYKSDFFDIKYEYYTLNKEESPAKVEVNQDILILDVGGAFGQVDISKMPWDSENKELSRDEVLWGSVPSDATIALFKKIYLANQLQDLNSLPFHDDTNEFHYEDPMFQYGTNNTSEAAAFQAANAVTQFAAPLIFGYIIGDRIEEAIRTKLETSIKRARLNAQLKGVESKPLRKIDVKRYKKAKLGGAISAAKKGETVTFFENTGFKRGKIGSVKAGQTVLKSADDVVPPKGFFKKIFAIIKKIFINKGTKLVAKGILVSIVVSTSLAWIPVVGQILDAAYNFIVTPLLILLSLPNGPITKAMDKWADSEGTCPTGSISLDQILPPGAEMLVAMIPILGDILDLFYPYLCSEIGTGLLVTKGPYNSPKYMDYPWLSTYFWNWPNYNGRYKTPVVQGKYLPTELMPSQPGYMGSLAKTTGANASYDLYNTPYNWTYGPYLNFDEFITSDPVRFDQVNKKLVAFQAQYDTQKFFPNNIFPSGSKFFYADFSDPNMLVDMAQFYYNFSIRNPTINEDNTVSVEIISKINYVIASSLYTCDVECEILNVTYDPSNGKSYNEYVTLNHDRRFYFAVDYTQEAPYYWENTATPGWATLDDKYDNAIYNLNEYLHRYNTFKPSEEVTPTVFIAAYEQIQNTSNTLSNIIASSNYTQDDYNIFNSNYLMAQSNYNDLIGIILKPTTTSGFDTQYRTRLDFRVSTVVGIKDELWNLQKGLNPISVSYEHPQYKLYGCTHLDDTAGSAYPPDIASLQDDSRKRVNFDVLPYLLRCANTFIDTNKCIDLSNVEQVIKMYKTQYPNKDIKSIVNIKAQGKNTCQFTWDEVNTGQNNLTRKEYKILYQTDLSSCTFCLPETLIAEGSSELPAIESIKMYKNTITDPISQQYNNDYNTRLGYKKAYYFQPTVTLSGPTSNIRNVTFSKVDNVDIIPRFDPNTFAQLPELVRPKKPIRISYPKPPESHLWKNSNDVCSNPDTLNKFILDYNNTNPSNKILSIIKAYTSDSNTCDLEVDLLYKYSENSNTVQRRTLSFNVKENVNEAFENIYTYDSLNNTDGLNIQAKTPNLNPPYSETGVTYGKPYNDKFNPTVISNISYFNNDLVTDFTKNTSGIVKNTRDLLIDLKGAQFLGDDSINCKKKCDDPEIMQRIMEQYNNDNKSKGRYDQENYKMYTIFKSATESADKCHIYFAQTNDYYADYYATNRISSNNYISESRPALRSVSMKQLPVTCDFVPVAGQTYIDISATDIALQSGIDTYASDSNFYTSSREDCTNLNCLDTSLISAAIEDYQNISGSIVTNVMKTIKVGNDTCDYNIIQDLNFQGDIVPDIESILRVRYKYPIYNKTNQNCASFTYEPAKTYDEETYKSDTFELQFAGNLDASDPKASPILSYLDTTNSTATLANAIQNVV